MTGIQFLAGTGDFSIIYSIQAGSGAHTSYLVGTGALFLGVKDQGVNVSTHLYLVPRSRMVEYISRSLLVIMS
jgi:hypothetical protein